MSGRGHRGRGWRGGGYNNWRGGRWGRGGRGGSSNSGSTCSLDSSRDDGSISGHVPPTPCPYPAWRSYLPDVPFSPSSSIVKLLKPISTFLKASVNWISKEDLYKQRFFLLDLKELFGDSPAAVSLMEAWPELKEEMENNPERVCGIFGLARHTMISGIREGDFEESLESETEMNFPVVRARPIGQTQETSLASLRSSYLHRMVTVLGTVVRVSAAVPSCQWLAFSCLSCKSEVLVHQPEGKYRQPTKCVSGCKNRSNFVPLRSSRKTICMDRQVIKLQEVLQPDDMTESGRVPRSLDCELTEDLCNSLVPGDIVRVTGIVKAVSGEEKSKAKSKNKSLYLLYLSTLSVSKSVTKDSRQSTLGIEFTHNDYALVQEIHSFGEDILKLLVASLCPSIYGHELVKAGFILGLFGGSTKNTNSALPVRGDPHILVVGDPGLGKSQMLNAACAVAPRGVFVTGNTSSATGLTVSLTKEAGNDFSLEAGALVLADQGCCCIDEFDKMNNQHQALLEAMEQQCISVAKAGVLCTLPARTAILAAANPVGGHYNRAKTVAENLKLGSALLSRFDLVFILIDRPDLQQDERLSEHVMKLHSKPGPTATSGNMFQGHRASSSNSSLVSSTQGVGQLSERLVVRPGEKMEPVPPVLLRKYIAYARRYVHPKLGPEAKRVLQDFYLQLRKMPQGEATPITTRQLESLIRLTEARARLALREEATQQDALDVVEIMRSSMVDTFSDNIGVLDFTRSQHGSGMSSRGAAKKFIQALQKQAERVQKATFTVEELRELASRAGVRVPSFMDFLESLNHQGYLIKKGNRQYQLLAADY